MKLIFNRAGILSVVFAVIAAFQSTPAWSQSVPPALAAQAISALEQQSQVGPGVKVRGLRSFKDGNHTIVCGSALTRAGWMPFYYDNFNLAVGLGGDAVVLCGR